MDAVPLGAPWRILNEASSHLPGTPFGAERHPSAYIEVRKIKQCKIRTPMGNRNVARLMRAPEGWHPSPGKGAERMLRKAGMLAVPVLCGCLGAGSSETLGSQSRGDAGIASAECVVVVDADGDGFPRYDITSCGAFGPDAGDALRFGEDCDDSDPDGQVLRYEDHDGDGFGAGERVCVPMAAEGFATSGTDCDDDDAVIAPVPLGAVLERDEERPLDGTDSNCDGNDFPFLNGTLEGALQLDHARLQVTGNVGCEGHGLAIVAVEHIESCSGGYALYLLNRGSEAVPAGEASLRTETMAYNLEARAWLPTGEVTSSALPAISAGEVIRTVAHEPAHVQVELVGATSGTCKPSSTTGHIDSPRRECFY